MHATYGYNNIKILPLQEKGKKWSSVECEEAFSNKPNDTSQLVFTLWHGHHLCQNINSRDELIFQQ